MWVLYARNSRESRVESVWTLDSRLSTLDLPLSWASLANLQECSSFDQMRVNANDAESMMRICRLFRCKLGHSISPGTDFRNEAEDEDRELAGGMHGDRDCPRGVGPATNDGSQYPDPSGRRRLWLSDVVAVPHAPRSAQQSGQEARSDADLQWPRSARRSDGAVLRRPRLRAGHAWAAVSAIRQRTVHDLRGQTLW